jgi:hypothetical protein
MLQLKLFYKILNKGELNEFLYLDRHREPSISQLLLKEKLKIL